MSCMEKKTALRVLLSDLNGFSETEAYNYFKTIIGEAEEVEFSDEEVDFFQYHGVIQPVSDYNGNWGVDYVLNHSSDWQEYISNDDFDIGIKLNQINDYGLKLQKLFNVPLENIKLVSYDWYNGGDEPIYF